MLYNEPPGQTERPCNEDLRMKWIASLLTLVLLSLADGRVAAQNPQTKNPFQGNPDAIRAGMGIFRARCADCHGVDARGIRSPDLTQVWASGRTDEGLFKTLRNGVPNTEMPAVGPRTSDDEIWKVLAYLRTLAAPAPTDPPRGNAENGQRLFRVQCSSCHRVNGQGGRLGPDLSRVGIARAGESVERQIRGALEGFLPGFEPVTLTTRGGQQIHGVKKNEDLFSVQIMDMRERIQGYLKGDMREVKDDKQSAMPAFGPERLSQSDVDDLLRYLSTLRGFDPAVPQK